MKNKTCRLLVPAGLTSCVLFGMFLMLSQPISVRGDDISPPTGLRSRRAVDSINASSTEMLDIQVVVDEIVADGLQRPVQATHAGDGSQRIFIVEQTGYIRIYEEGIVISAPFLAIPELIACCGEQGLLGLTFHPDYTANGYFYIYYTRVADGASVIARYSVSNDPNQADLQSAKVLLTINQPYSNHNGGQLAFGPDGYLYVGMGDGGSGGDPQNNAQDKNSLLGKMLRIDVNSGDPYGIPPDNPFVGTDGRDEIWALGLRNPWRFSFDRQNGDIFIADVGQNLWEEVNYVIAGTSGEINFGWRCREGTHVYSTSPPCDDPVITSQFIDPVAEYSHTEGQSISGGYVYRGSVYPNLKGHYFYADFVQGKIWSLYKTSPSTWSTPTLEVDTNFNISAFGEDENGEMYVLDYYGGTIRRLAEAQGPKPDLSASKKYSHTPYADIGETITYTIGLINTGSASANSLILTDTVPVGLAYVANSLVASTGVVDDSQSPTLHWQGALSGSQAVTLTYQAVVSTDTRGSIINHAQISSTELDPLTLSASLNIPKPVVPSTSKDFLFPGTQPNQIHDELSLSVSCDRCHSEMIYDKWRGSMMSQAGRDPLMWAALSVANHDAPNAGEYCLRCHTPIGWLMGRSASPDGLALLPGDIESGVACAVCHRMVDPAPDYNALPDEAWDRDVIIRQALTTTLPATQSGSAMLIVDPEDHRRGPFSLGQDFAYHLPSSTFQTNFHGKEQTDYKTRSRLCGSCHNVNNPLLSWDELKQEYVLNEMDQPADSFENGQLFPIETTYDEWLNSQYAVSGVYAPQFAGELPTGIVGACQDCHMLRSIGLAAEQGEFRDCQTNGCLPIHGFVGANTWTPQILQDSRWRLNAATDTAHLAETLKASEDMLRKAATLSVELNLSDTGSIAVVKVTNESGHKLPTGYAEGRRMWINLSAYDDQGELVYESGNYNLASGVLADTAKIYEIKQGITPDLAKVLDLPDGESFHFVLNNTVVKDNRIPPRGFSEDALNNKILQPVGAVYQPGQYWDETVFQVPQATKMVKATLYYQTASKEYIDFLRTRGGLDGYSLGLIWDGLKSPPVEMAHASDYAHKVFLPYQIK